MKDIKLKFTDKLDENQLAQEINSIEEINNPVIKEEEINNNPEPIIPSLSDEEIREMVMDEWENKTDIIEEEPIEEITPTPEPVIEEPIAKAIPKNTVRIMDGGFTF